MLVPILGLLVPLFIVLYAVTILPVRLVRLLFRHITVANGSKGSHKRTGKETW